jgi:hypothetical protein
MPNLVEKSEEGLNAIDLLPFADPSLLDMSMCS